jgi:hypothetical protein
LDGVQVDPLTQEIQEPELQTMLFPHDEPLPALPVVMHTEAPVEQDVVPTLHWVPAGVQGFPSAQSTHVPALQTLSAPQVIPVITAMPVSLHVGEPLVQTSSPLLHGLAGVQLCPLTQATHAPSLQT